MEQDTNQTPTQKPYTSPALTEFGDIHEITQGAGGTVTDAPLIGSQAG